MCKGKDIKKVHWLKVSIFFAARWINKCVHLSVCLSYLWKKKQRTSSVQRKQETESIIYFYWHLGNSRLMWISSYQLVVNGITIRNSTSPDVPTLL
jgi:hypothetical protein